ncbi:MAG TPA: hypothetical protein EYO51_00110 [Methylococcaceae bacterium]|jgi:hypothetical protein|nr:hypothetical protein [Methylococcaceae bacterium]HIN69150.1 hypothetical protein [Methylococcales bacterium]HIA45133.1 hypothetical protein [Methylococcaceae bacterium]HIB61568.1 hypothetical protein [Methylococcaceae bacterium]HIO13553.1 hypothetical protein [Methylococcales bacterium]
MKKQLAALFLMMVMMGPAGTAVAGGHSNVIVSTAVGMVKLPFKIVGGVVGGLVGAITGGSQGVVDVWSSINEEHATNPLLVLPVGVIGLVYAVPVGLATGAPSGAIETAQVGFNWM